MRRIHVATLATLAVASAAILPLTAAADPARHVHGSGDLSPFDKHEFVNKFNFEVKSAPDGSNVHGKVKVDGTIGDGKDKVKMSFEGTPTCITLLDDHTATFIIVFDKTKNQAPDVAGAQFWVQDNGKPDHDTPVDGAIDDRYNDNQLAHASCDTPAPRPIKTIAKGDILVNDD